MAARAPLIIGHRGAPGYRPEHSRSSYDLAFELGAEAVEPDVVFSRDGVLVVRHENEIGGTTDVADHPEFADRRTTKTIDGVSQEGWFTEDFTWEELSTLRVRERLPAIRESSASYDGTQPILRLEDVLDIVRTASLEHGRRLGVVVEIKHATYFAGLGFDVAGSVARSLSDSGFLDAGLPVIVESFEPSVLRELQALGLPAQYIFLLEHSGTPFDLLSADGSAAMSYRALALPEGLSTLAPQFDGISVDKRTILRPDVLGRASGSNVVSDAHDRGLRVFTWTARPENLFLIPQFRTRGGRAAFGNYAAEWRLLVNAGVDGIFADHPDLAVDVLAEDQ